MESGLFNRRYSIFLFSFLLLLFGDILIATRWDNFAQNILILQNMLLSMLLFKDAHRLKKLGILALIVLGIFFRMYDQLVPGFTGHAFHLIYLIYFQVVSYQIFHDLMYKKKLGVEPISASFSGFILLGTVFSLIFISIGAHGAFKGPVGTVPNSDFLYFSFGSIQTIDYGDITLVNEISKKVIVLQSLIGHFYTLFVVGIVIRKLLQSNHKIGRKLMRLPCPLFFHVNKRGSILIISSFFILLANISFGQEGKSNKSNHDDKSAFEKSDCVQKDIRDLVRGKKSKGKKPHRNMLLILPNVSYNPVNGVLLGAAGSTGFRLGGETLTRVSSVSFNASVTSKSQFLFFAKSNIYTGGNRFFLQGDWRFLIYNAYTWGLGTNAPDSIKSTNTLLWQGVQTGNIDDGYPMNYNYIKFHEILNYKLKENNYLGIGYHLDHFYKIRDNFLQLNEQPYEVTPHFVYSELYGFDTTQYTLSGVSLNYVYDSRDNMINPYKGYYINANLRFNPEFLGSSVNSSSLWFEFRTYASLSKIVPRHLVAFWFFSQVQLSGRQPYLTLMALGEDRRARSGRGYMGGRFRGEDLVYGEVEYRFPISPCSKILGGVLFLNATSASNRSRNVGLLDYIRPGAGFGLRVMLNKNFRTNINIDFAFGSKSQGLYFSGSETF
jgi:hypothetical protein